MTKWLSQRIDLMRENQCRACSSWMIESSRFRATRSGRRIPSSGSFGSVPECDKRCPRIPKSSATHRSMILRAALSDFDQGLFEEWPDHTFQVIDLEQERVVAVGTFEFHKRHVLFGLQ